MTEPHGQKVRRHLFVDPKVQGALIVRVVLYWLLCLGALGIFLLCGRVMESPSVPFQTHWDSLWPYFGPACLASLILLPLAVVDLLRLSNRFVGPLVRLRRSMRKLARGEHVDPICFRDNDFWHDFANEFNAVAARVQKESPKAEDTAHDDTGRCEAEESNEAVSGAGR